MKRTILLSTLALFSVVHIARSQPLPAPELNRLLRDLQKVPIMVSEKEYGNALNTLNRALPIVQGLMAEDPSFRTVYGYGLYLRGLCEVETQDYKAAEDSFTQFLNGYPTNPNAMKARLLLGECYLYQEDWASILNAIPPVLTSRMATFNEKYFAHQLIAEAFFQTEIWERAKPHYQWLFRNAPQNNPEMRYAAASQMSLCMIRLREFEELYRIMPYLHRTDAKYDIGLNIVILEEGDDFLMDERPDLALLMFRMVVPYAELKKKIESRRLVTEERLDRLRNLDASALSSTIPKQIRELERLLEEIISDEEDLSNYPDYDLELRTRLGDVYYALERWEEAIQLYLSIYERAPESELAERAMYSAYMTAFKAEEPIRAWEVAQKYIKTYPGGEYYDDVTLHAANLLTTLERWFEVEELVDTALRDSPDHVMLDNMVYIQGYALFMQSKLDRAIQNMARVLTIPNTTLIIPARYWKAMGHLFQQDYPDARAEFNTLVNTAQGGVLKEDSHYRMGVAAYGDGDFSGANNILNEFLGQYPDSHLASEAHAMIGDIMASDSRLDEAIARYQRAVETAHVDEAGNTNMVQVDYATFQQARTYELEGLWQEIIDLFDGYNEKFAGNGGNYTESTYWKGNALKRLNREEEALQLFYDAIVEYGDMTDAYGIDFILRDLTEEIKTNQGNQQLLNEVKDRLNDEISAAIEQEKQTLLLRLRGLQYETTENEQVKKIVKEVLLNESNIEIASPYSLDIMGRLADAEGNVELSRKVYEHFVATYEDSDLILHALVGLSENRIKEQRYGEAIDMLLAITDRYPTLPQAAEAYIRLGDVYRMVDEPEKALEVYSLILTVKDWRGALWPQALLKVGDTHAEQGNHEEAFGFYQRVYLMYLSYADYAAEAYYKSAQMLAKLGKNNQAKATIEEMLENDVLSGQPVASDARLLILKLP